MPLPLDVLFEFYEKKIKQLKSDWAFNTLAELESYSEELIKIIKTRVKQTPVFSKDNNDPSLQNHVCDFFSQNPELALYWIRYLQMHAHHYSCKIEKELDFFDIILQHLYTDLMISAEHKPVLLAYLVKNKKIHLHLLTLAIQEAIKTPVLFTEILQFITGLNTQQAKEKIGALNEQWGNASNESAQVAISLWVSGVTARVPYINEDISINNKDNIILSCFKFMLNEITQFETMVEMPEAFWTWMGNSSYNPTHPEAFQLEINQIFQNTIQTKTIVNMEVFLFGLINILETFAGIQQRDLLSGPNKTPSNLAFKIITDLAMHFQDSYSLYEEMEFILSSEFFAHLDPELDLLMQASLAQQHQRTCILVWVHFQKRTVVDNLATRRLLHSMTCETIAFSNTPPMANTPWHFLVTPREENNAVLELMATMMKIIDTRITFQAPSSRQFYNAILIPYLDNIARLLKFSLYASYKFLLTRQIVASFSKLGSSYQLRGKQARDLSRDIQIWIEKFDLVSELTQGSKFFATYQQLNEVNSQAMPIVTESASTFVPLTPLRSADIVITPNTSPITTVQELPAPSTDCYSRFKKFFCC